MADLREGKSTTEFWVTLLPMIGAIVINLASMFGGDVNQITQIASNLLAGITAPTYVYQRSQLKKNGNVPVSIPPLASEPNG